MKRILTLFLAIFFIASLFPTAALAAEGLSPRPANVSKAFGINRGLVRAAAADSLYDYEILTNNTIRITNYKSTAYYNVEVPSALSPNNLPVAEIAEYAFKDHAEIKTLIIPDSVTLIKVAAFQGCTNLKTATISKNIEVISQDAFYNCKRLESLTPNGMTPQSGRFILPDTLEEIGSNAFANCDYMQYVKLPNRLNVLGIKAFYDCDSLLEVNVPGSVKDINNYTFAECDLLRKVVLNEGVLNIYGFGDFGGGPFANCRNLTEMHLPDSIIFIEDFYKGNTPFDGCPEIVIYCTKGKYAYNYAKKYGLKVYAPLTKPAGIPTITETVPETRAITVKWDTLSDVSGYYVFRSTDGVNFSRLVTQGATSWKNEGLASGTTYYYKVCAYNEVDGKTMAGDFSDVVSVTTKGGAPSQPGTPSTPTTPSNPQKPNVNSGLTVTAKVKSYNSVSLSWNALNGMKGYEIERSTSPDSGYTTVKTTSAKKFTNTKLTPGVTYYYRVRGYKIINKTKITGFYSNPVAVTPTLATPTIKSVKSTKAGTAKATWKGATGASGYEVEYSNNMYGGYVSAGKARGSSITMKNMPSGNMYYVRVRAYKTINKQNIYGAYSAPVPVVVK